MTTTTHTLISIVVPIYNETEVIETFYKRMSEFLNSLDFASELIYVDDGSNDDSFTRLQAIAENDPRIRIIKFSRNFGHQIAITAGIDNAIGNAVVVIDSDLQDPPEVIKQFIDQWQKGYDIVYGIRIIVV